MHEIRSVEDGIRWKSQVVDVETRPDQTRPDQTRPDLIAGRTSRRDGKGRAHLKEKRACETSGQRQPQYTRAGVGAGAGAGPCIGLVYDKEVQVSSREG